MRNDITEPWGAQRIFFAGEHTSLNFPGTVQGAVNSGENAASAIAFGYQPATFPLTTSSATVVGATIGLILGLLVPSVWALV